MNPGLTANNTQIISVNLTNQVKRKAVLEGKLETLASSKVFTKTMRSCMHDGFIRVVVIIKDFGQKVFGVELEKLCLVPDSSLRVNSLEVFINVTKPLHK